MEVARIVGNVYGLFSKFTKRSIICHIYFTSMDDMSGNWFVGLFDRNCINCFGSIAMVIPRTGHCWYRDGRRSTTSMNLSAIGGTTPKSLANNTNRFAMKHAWPTFAEFRLYFLQQSDHPNICVFLFCWSMMEDGIYGHVSWHSVITTMFPACHQYRWVQGTGNQHMCISVDPTPS